MEELSIEQKAKAYDDALERAKKELQSCGSQDCDAAKQIFRFFPKLKESEENERIRRELIAHFRNNSVSVSWSGLNVKKVLDWLEKVKDFDKQLEDAYKTADEVQYNRGYRDAMEVKEKFVDVILDFPTEFEKQVSCFAASILNKEYDYTSAFIKNSAKGLLDFAKQELERQAIIKDGNSIDPHFGKSIVITETKTPKFHKGEWITDGNIHCKIIEILDDRYIIVSKYNKISAILFENENRYHLWTIQDAKDGDVLANDHHILILKELDYNWGDDGIPSAVKAYCGIKPYGNFEIGKDDWCFCGTLHIHPATKEQYEQLFQKMEEAGYTWDATTKELSHKEATKKSEQVWSEEDEKNLQGVIDEIQANKSSAPEYDLKTYDRFLSWLKSIKQRLS